MKKLLPVVILFITFFLLNGCIYSQSPSSGAVPVTVGNSAYFSVKIFPNDNNIKWSFDGEVVAGATGKSFIYTPEMTDVNTSHTVSVVASGDSASWTVSVLPPIYGYLDTAEQVQDNLYAAYAGIGYNDPPENDSFMYGVMFKDLNSLIPDIVIDTMMGDPDLITKLPALVARIATTFSYVDPDGNIFYVTINRDGLGKGFTGSLTANFGESPGYSGYTGVATYYGDPSAADLTTYLRGSFTIDINAAFPITSFSFSSISITAKDTLLASYPSSVNVAYNNWVASYNVVYGSNPRNTKLIPDMSSYEIPTDPYNPDIDNRLYTLDGGLSVNGKEYFFDSMLYQQTEDGTAVTVDISGELNALDNALLIVETSAINRHADGKWQSGSMTLSGFNPVSEEQENYNISFAADGSASGNEPASWDIVNWQVALEPTF